MNVKSLPISYRFIGSVMKSHNITYLPYCIIVCLLLHRNNECFRMKTVFLMQYHPFSKLEN